MAVPELKRRKYPEKMIIGTLAGAGTLGLLIPPSIILIIYGVTVNESIVKLFIAGVIPGIMLALMFMGYVAIWDLMGGRKDRTDTASYTMSDRIQSLGQLAPIMLLDPVDHGLHCIWLCNGNRSRRARCARRLRHLLAAGPPHP